MHVVVSLGTGRMPAYHVDHSDIYRPEGITDLIRNVKGVRSLGLMLVEAVSTVCSEWGCWREDFILLL